MAEAVLARQQGDDFQARMFWLNAALLLRDDGAVTKVLFETGPKAFDDVVIDYAPDKAPLDHHGKRYFRLHKQCKWHVKPGEFGASDLGDPGFIGAEANSFLGRARDAQLAFAPTGEGAMFELLTNWNMRPRDPLWKLTRTQWNALDLEVLFKGGPTSEMGKLRAAWAGHLGIDEDELRMLARTLMMHTRMQSGAQLREQLNDRFASVGMRQIGSDETGFAYDDLIRKLHLQGRKEFDRKSFKDLVREENLLEGPPEPQRTTVGVRSFMHPIDNLSIRVSDVLDLVEEFDGRYLREGRSWNEDLLPRLREFVLDAARQGDHMRLVLDAHVSLAFAVGSILNVKAGKSIEIEQRTNGKRFWSAADVPIDSVWPTIVTARTEMESGGSDLAVAIGLTHDIVPMVHDYLKSRPDIGALLTVTLDKGSASGASVKSGSHAMMLAEAVAAAVRKERRGSTLHVFIAAPNGFTFFLGQQQQALGRTAVYEWDHDGPKGNGYSEGIIVG
ncbi:SAVED domain-containing protein [Rhizobium laguerreae]|uniref:SAVED domain-containing protein n=1 Tax=Rhizobium TaxID=379 RepID=UPI00103D3B9E|nr:MULTISPECIES: SAVED domain-containing protein [Rhizobium]NKJ77833.1 SAVED domain-containing protein [Rhizobium leguminosarum bv. viciae]TBX74474.1 SAVED domain-containing protein [Rhizobium laguerreae]